MTGGIVRIGVAGWTYAPWRGVFYPKGLRREQELGYSAERLRTLEITDTFYGLQRPEAFASWVEQVPADFVFAVTAPRAITHILRLQDAQVALANFIASGLLRLGVHLGPILWRLPRNFRFDVKRITAFLGLLPHDTAAAAALGRRHDASLRAPAWLNVDIPRRVRHAFEINHESFRCQAFIDLLRAHDVALVCADSGASPRLMDVTSDFIYCRLRAPRDGGGYDNAMLDIWARRFNSWARGEEPPDAERVGGTARAPGNAMELIRRVRS